MNEPSSRRPAVLLLIEDNPGDARLVDEALRESGAVSTLHVVSDGDEALEFIHQRGEYESAPRPDLVLLDWNVPRVSGEDILAELKSDPALKRVPVTVLTGSQDARDIERSYHHHANACLKKAVEPGEFMDMIRSYTEFWLSTARLPAATEEC